MKVLFIFCEGPHDAHFVGRILRSSENYHDYTATLRDYPTPLGQFIGGKFQNQKIDDIRIGKPNFPLVPVCCVKKSDDNFLVFPISIGGMDKTDDAKSLLEEILNSFAHDILERPEVGVSSISILFTYDADARGTLKTVQLWKQRFFPAIDFHPQAEEWIAQNGYRIGVFIFSGPEGNIGTLEDCLVELFRVTDSPLMEAATTFLEPRFETISANGDALAHETKFKKGILTICGQVEKVISGSALTVVVRDSKLLDGAFNFLDKNAQCTRLLHFINGAFQ